jgi:uncharacterized membrane protein required for colicin V production
MTIWILALVLVASLAALGYRQGVIRVSFSLLGIFAGVLLAVPLSKPMEILLKAFGMTHPMLLWLVPPFVAFCLVSAIFKGIALAVHHKVDVYFKYKAGDLRYTLWERLSRRLGLCLGIVNGVAYMTLISFVIYIVGYWTVQLESSEGMSKLTKLTNQAARDLQSAGFDKTARALDAMPESYYDAADLAGLIYQNSLLEARLARYPAFLALAENPEFQALNNPDFSAMRVRQDSIAQVLDYGPVKQIWENPETLKTIWRIVEPNLKDLRIFLETGQSPKFADEPILGRWTFTPRGTVAFIRRSSPNISSTEMARVRNTLTALFSKSQLVIGTDNFLAVKDWPTLKKPANPKAGPELASGQGRWDGANGRYNMDFNIGGKPWKPTVIIEGDRLTVVADKLAAVFDREY